MSDGNDDPQPVHAVADNKQDNLAESLKDAISRGETETVKDLVKDKHLTGIKFKYALYDHEQEETTPLILAAKLGNSDITKALLVTKADVDAVTSNGSTALHIAAENDHLNVATILIEDKNAKSLLNERDHMGRTPLLTAAAMGSLETFRVLLGKKADLKCRDSNGETALHLASRSEKNNKQEDYLHIVEKALTTEPTLLDQTNNNEETALIIAVMQDQKPIVEFLIEKGANIESRDTWGYTPLINATVFNCESVIQTLLNAGANPAARHNYGTNSIQIACEQNYETIVFQMLESRFYFPLDPFDDDVHLSTQAEQESICQWLLGPPRSEEEDKEEEKWKEERQKLTTHHIVPVFYWAILNGVKNLIDFGLELSNPPALKDRSGATWLHVFALSGKTEILNQALYKKNATPEKEDDILGLRKKILTKASGGLTPLHVAAKKGHSDMTSRLLELLDARGSQDILDVILKEIKGVGSLISLAADGINPEAEKKIWEKMRVLIIPKTGFEPHSENVERVVEAAAWRYTTGEERYFNGFMHVIGDETSSSGALELVIKHRYPSALWWLLSSSPSFIETDIKKGEDFVKQYHVKDNRDPDSKLEQVIEKLLANPPPLRRPSDDKGTPQFEYSSSMVPADEPKGTVLNLTVTSRGQLMIKLKRAEIKNIIYDLGPNNIMSVEGYRDPSEVQDAIFRPKPPDSGKKVLLQGQQKSNESKQPKPSGTEASNLNKSLKDFRWIHIPTNNLQYVKDLMVTISQEKKQHTSKHRRLAGLVKKSWFEIPAGAGTHYMKPACRLEKADDMQMLALFVPYLSWAKEPSKDDKCNDSSDHEKIEQTRRPNTPLNEAALTGSTSEESGLQTGGEFTWPDSKQDSRQIIHKALTLDQYYYESLEDTKDRDRDQVLGRLFRTKNESPKIEPSSQKQSTGRQMVKRDNKPPIETTAQTQNAETQILMVNQLWLWILHDDTIITCVTKEDEKTDKTFLQRVLDNLYQVDLDSPEPDKKDSRPQPNLYNNQIVQVILDTARSMLYARDIQLVLTPTEKIAPLDAYRIAIQNKRDEEMKLFKVFQESLDSNNENVAKDRNNSKEQRTSETTLHPGGGAGGSSIVQEQENLHIELPTAISFDFVKYMWKKVKATSREYSKTKSAQKKPQQPQDQLAEARQIANPPESLSQDILEDTQNPYEKIGDETKVLQEIKDILDELNILKNLAQEQDYVNALLKRIHLQGMDQGPTVISSEYTLDIESMIKDAQNVQSDINILLDLKQKKAGIMEAKATRNQSDTVMTFTVVTIIFLPASFLTSLFALNVSDFPHENGNVAYKGWWIFPIIFGVSFIVSAFFVVLAFNTSLLKTNFQREMDGMHRGKGREEGSANESRKSQKSSPLIKRHESIWQCMLRKRRVKSPGDDEEQHINGRTRDIDETRSSSARKENQSLGGAPFRLLS